MTLPSEASIPSRARRGSDTPLRTCVGCRRVLPASRLYRCRLGRDQRVVLVDARQGPDRQRAHDDRGGRGAWLCSVECAEAAGRTGAFDRAFRARSDATGLADAMRHLVAESADSQ